jgi:hypothetical protein
MKNKTLFRTLAIVLSALMAGTGLFSIITYAVYLAAQHAH